MKLILLQGPSHCGKTETFIKLREKIMSAFGGAELHFERINNSRDFQSVIKCNGKLIALFSMGDLKGECIKAILKYLGLDVLVLAENSGFKISLFEEVPLKLSYTKISGEEPPAHVIVKMLKKTTQEEMAKEEDAKVAEILAELIQR